LVGAWVHFAGLVLGAALGVFLLQLCAACRSLVIEGIEAGGGCAHAGRFKLGAAGLALLADGGLGLDLGSGFLEGGDDSGVFFLGGLRCWGGGGPWLRRL
jgi:hypothetical protein